MDCEDILFILGLIFGVAICSALAYYCIIANWWIAIPIGIVLLFCVLGVGLDVLHKFRGK